MATQAAWRTLNGSARIMAEHKHMQKLIKDGSFPQVSELAFVQDQVHTWQFKLRNFDNDQAGGAQLNKDLQTLKQRYGQDYILMEIRFPDDYPTKPFFLRVVKPRMVMYTGHVTAGGSICIESLTLSGRPSGWQSYYSVETILLEVLSNMIDSPVVYIETPTGPGGLTGPLRVDLNYGLTEYGLGEAKSAFARTEANHRAVGWGKSIALAPPSEPDVGETSQRPNDTTHKEAREPDVKKPSYLSRRLEKSWVGRLFNKQKGKKETLKVDREAQPRRSVLMSVARLRLEEEALKSYRTVLDAAKALGYIEPPDHWSLCNVTAKGGTVFIDLPLITATNISSDDVLELECNGMTKEQAVKALQEAGGDLARALDSWLVKCGLLKNSNGRRGKASATTSVPSSASATTTPQPLTTDATAALTRLGLTSTEARFLLQMFCGNIKPAEQWVKSVGLSAARTDIERNKQVVRQKIQEEIKTVLNSFEAHGGMKPDRVKKVERVQNLSLWTRYQSKKTYHGGSELHVFHGTSPDAVTAITNAGFDMQHSKYSQLMYFAQCSAYSHTYSQDKAGNAGCAKNLHANPGYMNGHFVMLLCKVAGGRNSTSASSIYTINHNDQAYPAYVIHYK